MKRILCMLVLIAATAMLAQRPGQPPPQSTPPTFPQGQIPPDQMPPDQKAPPQELSTSEVQRQIQKGFNSEPMLRHSNLTINVTADSVILSGTVESEEQRDVALRIARSYAGDRKVVDKIELMQHAEIPPCFFAV